MKDCVALQNGVQHIPATAARNIPVASTFTITEYGILGDGVANASVATINGRYPAKGWGLNTQCDELVYVLSGEGSIEMPGGSMKLILGSVAFIKKGQKIAWQGKDLTVFIPCVPAWNAGQHVLTTE